MPLTHVPLEGGELKYTTEIFVPDTSPTDAHRLWLTEVWVKGGGLPGWISIVQAGDDISKGGSGAGCLRRPAPFLYEEIICSSVGKGVDYRITKGPFPVSYHYARVTFAAKNGGTVVSWTVSYTPLACCTWIVNNIISSSFGTMLKTMRDAAAKSN